MGKYQFKPVLEENERQAVLEKMQKDPNIHGGKSLIPGESLLSYEYDNQLKLSHIDVLIGTFSKVVIITIRLNVDEEVTPSMVYDLTDVVAKIAKDQGYATGQYLLCYFDKNRLIKMELSNEIMPLK